MFAEVGQGHIAGADRVGRFHGGFRRNVARATPVDFGHFVGHMNNAGWHTAGFVYVQVNPPGAGVFVTDTSFFQLALLKALAVLGDFHGFLIAQLGARILVQTNLAFRRCWGFGRRSRGWSTATQDQRAQKEHESQN